MKEILSIGDKVKIDNYNFPSYGIIVGIIKKFYGRGPLYSVEFKEKIGHEGFDGTYEEGNWRDKARDPSKKTRWNVLNNEIVEIIKNDKRLEFDFGD